MKRAWNCNNESLQLTPLLERRQEMVRIPMACRVSYTYQEGVTYTTEGLLRDMSEVGCGIRGQRPPAVGTRLTITLYLADGEPPICICFARVAWIAGHFFGVQFGQLGRQHADRLRRHLRKLSNGSEEATC